jgi:FkbM family methyltransferase
MDKNGELVDGRGTYQLKKWHACLPWIKNWRTAVDVGAHVGFWSMQMAKRFKNVFAYEPMREYRDCFLRNVDPEDWEARAIVEGWGCGGRDCNVELFPYALGAGRGRVKMVVPRLDGGLDTGGTHVGTEGEEVELRRLDDEFLHVPDAVDFIKIDCEGYEAEVVRGAEGLIRAARPCVIVEQKQHKMAANYGTSGTPAVDLLREMGAVLRHEIGGDYILSWPDAA